MDSVVEAEVKLVFSGGALLGVLVSCSKLFPDSTIARAFKCGRTKAMAIFKVIVDEAMKELLDCLQQLRFFSFL